MNKDRHVDIMGIVNLTDDSFYEGSRTPCVSAATDRIGRMLDEGADIIDIGACSTRPGALPVGADEEWRRLAPVLEEIRKLFPSARISVDTYWSEVVRRTYDLIGNFIVNDVSSGQLDGEMLGLVGSLGLNYIAMHSRGTSQTMQSLTDYADIVGDVLTFFNHFAENALKNGIKSWVLDPGFGFAKTVVQNYEILSRLDELKSVGQKVLVGVSRKSMVYKPLKITPENALTPTQVLHFKALQKGADILRVHDVKETVQTVKLYRMLG